MRLPLVLFGRGLDLLFEFAGRANRLNNFRPWTTSSLEQKFWLLDLQKLLSTMTFGAMKDQAGVFITNLMKVNFSLPIPQLSRFPGPPVVNPVVIIRDEVFYRFRLPPTGHKVCQIQCEYGRARSIVVNVGTLWVASVVQFFGVLTQSFEMWRHFPDPVHLADDENHNY